MKIVYRASCRQLFCFVLLILISSAVYAGDVKVTKDVVYGLIKIETPRKSTVTDDPKPEGVLVTEIKLLLDVYEPSGFSGKRPGLLLIHGGGWAFGDKADQAVVAKQIAEKGYVVYSVNYRLAPKFHYPAQIDDVQRAVRWVRIHSADYSLDPDRLAAMGDSAGGYLAAMLGTLETRDNSDTTLSGMSSRVQCVVDLYGPVDFTAPASSVKFSSLAAGLLEGFFGKKRDDAMELYREGSPMMHIDKKCVPFVIMHGDADPLVPLDQSQRFNDALIKAGIESSLIVMEKDGHGFHVAANKEKMLKEALDFLNRHLKP